MSHFFYFPILSEIVTRNSEQPLEHFGYQTITCENMLFVFASEDPSTIMQHHQVIFYANPPLVEIENHWFTFVSFSKMLSQFSASSTDCPTYGRPIQHFSDFVLDRLNTASFFVRNSENSIYSKPEIGTIYKRELMILATVKTC